MIADFTESSPLQVEEKPGIDTWVAVLPKTGRLRLMSSHESALPAFYSNANRTAVFHGILYNRTELMDAFGPRQISNGSNDAEIIFQAYAQFGESFLEKVKGVYLLAILDRRDNLLLCARDRSGVYPVFYTETGNEFLFSISPEDLVRQPDVSNSINRALIVEHFSQRRPLPEETFFSSIKRVLPGHALRMKNRDKTIFRYWYSFPENGQVEWISSDDGIAQFDSTLEQAVSRCMTLGHPGIFLSGGLDSVSVASVAADLTKRRGAALPRALSLVFPHPDCNEEHVQKGVAEQLGFQQSLIPVDSIVPSEGLLWGALELAKVWSQPMWNCWKPLYLYLGTEGKRHGCQVILTGGGGDDWLTVNTNYAADLIRYLNIIGLNAFVKSMRRSYKLPKWPQLRYILWNSGGRPLVGMYVRKMIRTFPSLYRDYLATRIPPILPWLAADPELKKEVDRREELLLQQILQEREPEGRYGFYTRSFTSYFVNTVASMEMENDFESSRKMGISVLHPYFDPDLIELLLRMTPEFLQRAGMEKGIVRDAVARRFPDLKFQRQQKVTAIGYFQSLIKNEGPVAWEKLGGIDSLIRCGIVNSTAVDTIRRQGFTGQNPAKNHGIWNIISMEAWLRTRV